MSDPEQNKRPGDTGSLKAVMLNVGACAVVTAAAGFGRQAIGLRSYVKPDSLQILFDWILAIVMIGSLCIAAVVLLCTLLVWAGSTIKRLWIR